MEAGAEDTSGVKPAGFNQLNGIIPAGIIDAAIAHIREILVVLCVFILGAAIWGGYITYKDREETKASLLLADAISGTKEKNTIDILNEIVQKYSNSQACKEALLMLGSAYRDAGQTDKALDAFSRAKKLFQRDSGLFATSSLGIGYLNEDKRILEQAKKEFMAADRNKTFSSIATLDIARVLAVSGDRDGALEAYNRYLSLTKEPAQLDFVRYKIMELSKEKGNGGKK